jgi:hypothetical protein
MQVFLGLVLLRNGLAVSGPDLYVLAVSPLEEYFYLAANSPAFQLIFSRQPRKRSQKRASRPSEPAWKNGLKRPVEVFEW